jgi:hypothetical protein
MKIIIITIILLIIIIIILIIILIIIIIIILYCYNDIVKPTALQRSLYSNIHVQIFT